MTDTPHRRNYDDEFKRKAVAFYLENKESLSSTAATFGVTAGMLYKWLQRFSPESAVTEPNSQSTDTEFERLSREIKNLNSFRALERSIEYEIARLSRYKS